MMGNIFCAVDWKNIFPTLTRNNSPTEVLQLHSLIFDILVRLACEEAILEVGELNEFKLVKSY